jgi:glycosyltransferase involved in cell wall biosynthesis
LKRSIIFVNSLFPCLSETFVFDQLMALEANGLALHIVSNNRPDPSQVHPRMRDIQSRVRYLSDSSPAAILAAHLLALLKHPLRYLACLAGLPFSQERLAVSLAQFTGAALILRHFAALPNPHVHAHFTYGAAGVAYWTHRLGGIPYSLTLHGSDLIFDNPPDLHVRLAAADAIVSISRFNVDFLHQHFPDIRPKRLEVIRMGVPRLDVPPRRHERGRQFRLLNVGRLSEHKAQHHLIDACALLAERGLDFRCDIVGEGDKRAARAARIERLGLADRVELLGPRFHDEVLALYDEADLFVLCSIAEGQPIVLMEAMRAGIPLIATDISAIPELVQDGGIIVPAADPAALADAIEALALGRRDTVRMTARAREIIAGEYDLATNHRKFRDFLAALP